MHRPVRALALAAVILSPLGAIAAEAAVDPAVTPAADTADEDLSGTVGVCVRWGVDPSKLAEVVVVRPSGDDRVDAIAMSTLKDMPFPKPPGDTGAWRPMSMGIGGVEPPSEPPSCAGLASVSDESEPLVDKPLPKQIAA